MEIVEDVEGLSWLIAQGLAEWRARLSRAGDPEEASKIRVEEASEEYRLWIPLREGDQRDYDVQISGQRVEFRGPSGRDRDRPESPYPPKSVVLGRPVDGWRASISADSYGIRVVVPKRRVDSRADPAPSDR